jgi:hypothetical protein
VTKKTKVKSNKITWENWNAKEQEHLQEKKSNTGRGKFADFIVDEEDAEAISMEDFGLNNNIMTPFGVFPVSSMLKPSDRWDCWVAHANFSITNGMANVINRNVEGVAALNILDRYTFVVGVPRQFEWREVRLNIEKAIVK